MNRSKAVWFVVSMLIVSSMILTACAPAPTATPTQAPAAQPTSAPAAQPTTAPQPTTPPQPTAVPPTEAPKAPTAKDPTVWNYQTFGDPTDLDPSVDYETAGQGVFQGNIYQQLIAYKGMSVNEFVPTLATEIPQPQTLDNGGVQYVWKIKPGVKWASGNPFTAEDAAYGLWRTMLNGDPNTPAFLLTEAFFDVDDASQIVVAPDGSIAGDPDSIKKANAAKLEETCTKVKDAVQFDNAAGVLTTTLSRPWGPFMLTMAGTWASPQEKAWVAAQGEWDGDCKTWQNFYGMTSETSKIRDKTNGTGPYQLDHWTPNEEIVLTLNPNYTGDKPAIERVVIKNVQEFGTRFAALQAGDADYITLGSTADWAQMDTLVKDQCDYTTGECKTVNPDGILRVYKPVMSLTRTDIFFNFAVPEGSPYVGSGKLDGSGIPLDFFSDANVRKAFNYCFDWDTYIKDVQLGEGTQSLALTLPGQPGYDGSPAYTFDLNKCADAFKASTLQSADGKSLWDTGFYMQMAYNAGNTARQSIAEILAANLQQVNPKFFVAPVAMPWPTFLAELRAKKFPLATSGWQEDIHDPHNWYVPYLLGTYASRFNIPKDLQDKYKALIDQGVKETDTAKRAAIYSQLNQAVYDDAPLIILSFANGHHYEPLYVKGWWGGNMADPLYSPPTGVWTVSKQ
ncbi:MAG TPA: ABC transporter substrate-binding protein [Anaerolineae bacterium]|nr:ABC transporter substrate-binding protein [Anaerolineae bacterium]